MHRPSSFPVHLHGRLHRLPLSPSLSLSLPPFLHSVDRARFSFGERKNIEYNMGRGARIIYTRRLGFFQKNSHKESDLIRFRRRIFIRGGRSVHARGWPSEKTRKKDRGEGGKKGHAYTYGETKRNLHLFRVAYYTRAATRPIENDNSAPPVRKTTRIFAPDFAIPVTLESSLPGELTRVPTYLRANLQTI